MSRLAEANSGALRQGIPEHLAVQLKLQQKGSSPVKLPVPGHKHGHTLLHWRIGLEAGPGFQC